jgi:hypothetical protein
MRKFKFLFCLKSRNNILQQVNKVIETGITYLDMFGLDKLFRSEAQESSTGTWNELYREACVRFGYPPPPQISCPP